jgi:hypothetical protein
MRIRFNCDPVLAFYVSQIAKREGRTITGMLRLLVGEAVERRRGAPTAPITAETDECRAGGIVIGCYANGELNRAVRRFAAAEDRSLSSALKTILCRMRQHTEKLRAASSNGRSIFPGLDFRSAPSAPNHT